MNNPAKIHSSFNWFVLRILACFLLIISFPKIIIGQEKLRLEDCYELALTNRSEVKNAKIDIQNANWELEREKTGLLPSFNISYSHSLNYNNKTNYFLGDFSGILSTSSNMKIFDWFSVWRQIDIAELKLYQQKQNHNNKELDICMAVAESFFSLLFIKEQLLATKRQLNITDSILEKTKLLYSLGKIMQNDVEEAILQHIQEKKSQILLQRDYELSVTALLEILQFHDGNLIIDFDYYENYSNIDIDNKKYYDYENSVIESYPLLKVLETEKKILLLNDQLIRRQNRPSVSLNYSLSTGYSELAMNNSEINFYDNIYSSFAGLLTFALSIPIFNNREIITNLMINEANIRKFENTYSAKLLNLKADLRKRFIDANASVEMFQSTQLELKRIKKILENRILLYTNGKNDIFTVLTYKKQYNEIEKTYIIAKYEAILKNELFRLYTQL